MGCTRTCSLNDDASYTCRYFDGGGAVRFKFTRGVLDKYVRAHRCITGTRRWIFGGCFVHALRCGTYAVLVALVLWAEMTHNHHNGVVFLAGFFWGIRRPQARFGRVAVPPGQPPFSSEIDLAV